MNLPTPEDSGVPPDNPDFCILRIRRNHLIEVQSPIWTPTLFKTYARQSSPDDPDFCILQI